MDLKDIASVSEKRGLYKVLKPTRSGVILETLDATRKKLVASANSRVSILKEISIYTTGAESSVLLEEVFELIHKAYGFELSIDPKADDQELFSFLSEILPDYDEDRVYASDVKKLITWYKIVATYYPEVFTQESSDKKEANA